MLKAVEETEIFGLDILVHRGPPKSPSELALGYGPLSDLAARGCFIQFSQLQHVTWNASHETEQAPTSQTALE